MTETTKIIQSYEEALTIAVKMTIKAGRPTPDRPKPMNKQECEYFTIDKNTPKKTGKVIYRWKSDMCFEMPYKRVVAKTSSDMGMSRPGITCIVPAESDSGNLIQYMNAVHIAAYEAAISGLDELPDFITFIPKLVQIDMGRGKTADAYEALVVTKEGILNLEQYSTKYKTGKESEIVDKFFDTKRVGEKETIEGATKRKAWVFNNLTPKKQAETLIYQPYSLDLPSKAQALAAGLQLPPFRKKNEEATKEQLNPKNWGISIKKIVTRTEGDEVITISEGNWVRDPTCFYSTNSATRAPFVGQATISFDLITASTGNTAMKCNWIGIAAKYPESSGFGNTRPEFGDGHDLDPVAPMETHEAFSPVPKRTAGSKAMAASETAKESEEAVRGQSAEVEEGY
jgi:hypothetical protein